MFAFKMIFKNVFNFSINVKNMMSIFFNLFNYVNIMRFFKRFDLLYIKKKFEKRKIFILYKRKLTKCDR